MPLLLTVAFWIQPIWADNEFSLTAFGLTLSDPHFHSGWTVGGGAEWVFAGPWSADSENYFGGIAPPNVGFGMDVHTVKAGVNYRFGWASPVVANY